MDQRSIKDLLLQAQHCLEEVEAAQSEHERETALKRFRMISLKFELHVPATMCEPGTKIIAELFEQVQRDKQTLKLFPIVALFCGDKPDGREFATIDWSLMN